jgi:hypothetical protein
MLPSIGSGLSGALATGSIYGGASGAAQDANSMQERLQNTATGIVGGFGTGGLLYPVSKGIGAGLGSLLGANKGTSEMLANAPARDVVKSEADNLYATLRKSGVVYDPNSYKSFAKKLVYALHQKGWRPDSASPITKDVRDIVNRIGKPNDFQEIEILRERAGNLPKNASDKDFMHASMIKKAIDNFFDTGEVISTKGLPPEQIGPMARQARELARRNIIAKEIEAMQRKQAGYLAGEESAMRNQFGTYLKGDPNLTDMERKAFEKVVRREGLLGISHGLGSRLGQYVTAAISSAGGIPGMVAGYGLNWAARKGMEKMTNKAVERALKTVLAGKAAQQTAKGKNFLLGPSQVNRVLLPGAGLLGSHLLKQYAPNR